MDRLDCLAAFVEAADSGSFARAAERLRRTPAMVGRQVRWLEDRLGAALMIRTTRRQSLTEAGWRYLEHARIVLAELAAGTQSVSRLRASPSGLLRIDAPHGFGATCLAPAMGALLDRYPDLRVELTLNNRIVDLVEEGYDAVIRTGALADSSLIARKLAPYRLIACAAPAYIARCGMPVAPDELASHSCLRFRPQARSETWPFVDRHGNIAEASVTGAFLSNSGQALRAAALAGVGIIVQPATLVADDLAAGTLARIMPDWEPPSLPVHILYAAHAASPKLRAFVDFVVERFGPD